MLCSASAVWWGAHCTKLSDWLDASRAGHHPPTQTNLRAHNAPLLLQLPAVSCEVCIWRCFFQGSFWVLLRACAVRAEECPQCFIKVEAGLSLLS